MSANDDFLHNLVQANTLEGINELMSNLHSSIEDTKRYKDEVSQLAVNLSHLNNVYGNMLSAMNVNVHANTTA